MNFSLKELERELFLATEKAKPQDALKIERQYKLIEKLKKAEITITPMFYGKTYDGFYNRRRYAIHTSSVLFDNSSSYYSTRWIYPSSLTETQLLGRLLENAFPFGITEVCLFDDANILFSRDGQDKIVFNKECPDYSTKKMGRTLSVEEYFKSYAGSWLDRTDADSIPEWMKPCFEHAMNARILA